MAVTTTKTNKPLNPRGNDQSPKGFNRAELYTGKALDFDGVNDYVDLDGFTMAGDVATIVFQAKFSNDQYVLDVSADRFVIRNRAADGFSVFNTTAWTKYGDTLRDELGFYAVVSDGTTQRVYYNGHQLGDDQTVTALDWDSATKFKIGAGYTGGSNFFDGQLSGFKIFNTALTAAQVADLYNNPEKIVPTGVSNDALKLWLPMQEGAGTTAFNGAPDALGSELITNGDFSDGTNNWTATNAVIYASNNQITVDDSTNLGGDSRATQTFTTEVGKKYRLVFTKVSTTSLFYLGIGAGSAYNNIFYSHLGTDTGIHTIEFTATSTTSTIALITGGTGISVFANVSIKEQTGFGTISGATWTHGIGAPVAQTAVIDWNKVSDGTNEVLLPAGLTTGRDITGVNLFENARKQGALNLDGNSWAEVHDNASLDMGTGSFSLEAWAKVKFVNAGSSYNVIMTLGGSVTNDTGMALNSSLAPRFEYNGDASTGSALTAGDWIHIVATYDETKVTLYINASQEGQHARTAVDIDNALVKQIGRDSTSSRHYHDQIAQPRIYNRALNASEIERNYNAGKNTYK